MQRGLLCSYIDYQIVSIHACPPEGFGKVPYAQQSQRWPPLRGRSHGVRPVAGSVDDAI